MKKEIEKDLGSWDLKVGSFSYVVVYLKREKLIDVCRQSFFPLAFQALFFANVV